MTRPPRRKTTPLIMLAALVLGGTGCGATDPAGGAEEDYPTRPITWIVPYDPGGASDQQIRRIQEPLQEALGQDVNIVYQPGGDGATGWQNLATARPDGYTIGNVVLPNVILTSGTGYEAEEFEYVAFTESAPIALAVDKDSPFEDLESFIAAAEEDPGSLSVAGIGENSELALAEIANATGIEVSYVPVSGGAGPIVTDLQGGHVDAAVFSATHTAAHAEELRALAIAGTEESPALPGVETFDSLGYSGVNQSGVWGVALPPETPEPIVQAVSEALGEVMDDPQVVEQIEEDGLVPMRQEPDEATATLEEHTGYIEEARELLG